MRHCEPVRYNIAVSLRASAHAGVAAPRIFKAPRASSPCPLLLGEGAAAAAGVEGTPYRLVRSRMKNVQPAGTENVFLLLEEGGTAEGRDGWWRGAGIIKVEYVRKYNFF